MGGNGHAQRCTMAPPAHLMLFAGVLVLAGCVEHEQYTAFSLNRARKLIEHTPADWRTDQPQVLKLGGINCIRGVVYDKSTRDFILVGQHNDWCGDVTLDDVVVVLRARLRQQQWPRVKGEAGRAATPAAHVSSAVAGIAVARRLADANGYFRQRIVTPLQSVPAKASGGPTPSAEKQANREGHGERDFGVRPWFFVVNSQVRTGECVATLGATHILVFPEFVGDWSDTDATPDRRTMKREMASRIASHLHEHLAGLSKPDPAMGRLWALQQLVALSAVLERSEQRPGLSFWLHEYELPAGFDTEPSRVVPESASGVGVQNIPTGLQLMALTESTTRSLEQDMAEAVLSARPPHDALVWSFNATHWRREDAQERPVRGGRITWAANRVALGLHEHGRWQAAAQLCKELLEIDSADVDALAIRAGALQHLGQFSQSLDHLNRALHVAPNDATLCGARGVVLHHLDELSEALDSYDRSLGIVHAAADVWANKGITLFDMGENDRAIACFEHAIGIKPDLAEAWNGKASALIALERYEKAAECANRAVDIAPENSAAWYNKGIAMGELDHPQKALESFDRALQFDPEDAHAWGNKGVALDSLGHHTKALRCYDRALQLEPRNAGAWREKGASLVAVGHYAEALRCLDRAIRIEPNDPATWYSKGVALQHLGRSAKAHDAFERAADLGSSRAREALAQPDVLPE